MEKYFKILVIQVLLKNNHLAKSGDVVKGDKFINLQESLDGKYIEECDAPKNEDNVKKLAPAPGFSDAVNLPEMTKTELKAYALENDLNVDLDAKKADLLAEIQSKIGA